MEKSQKDGATDPKFEFIHSGKLVKNLKPIQWRIHGILEDNVLFYDFGDSGSYKSFGAIDRGLCIASGLDYHGHPVKQAPVFYIPAEGQQGLGRRIAAWHIKHKTRAEDVPFFVSKTPTQLMNEIAIGEVKRSMQFWADKFGSPAMVYFDTLGRNFGSGDEGNTADILRVVQNLDIFQGFASRGVAHHTGHKNKERARGPIALQQAADTIFWFKLTSGENIMVTNTKSKDAPKSTPMLFSTEIIPLIIENKPENSLVLNLKSEGVDAIEKTAIKGMSSKQKTALSILRDLYADFEENLAKDGRSGQKTHVEIKCWKEACLSCGTYARSDAFERGIKRLFDSGFTVYDESRTHVYPIDIYKKYYPELFD